MASHIADRHAVLASIAGKHPAHIVPSLLSGQSNAPIWDAPLAAPVWFRWLARTEDFRHMQPCLQKQQKKRNTWVMLLYRQQQGRESFLDALLGSGVKIRSKSKWDTQRNTDYWLTGLSTELTTHRSIFTFTALQGRHAALINVKSGTKKQTIDP